ncbi:MAG: ATPase [Deltaproteobacteria bacterium]|nr:ATPase [Deltaproteobacteria bacterium]
MEKQIGTRLLEEKVITEEQLTKALERQRLHGGRIGHNLAALGYLSSKELGEFFRRHPAVPQSVEATGLDIAFISDLIIKHVLFKGEFTIPDIADGVKLPISVVDVAVERLRMNKFIEVKGAAQYARVTYKFSITDLGKKRASELLEICRYVGPAPVPLDDYKTLAEFQTIKNLVITDDAVKKAFAHIIIKEELLRRIGPAISSGKAIFLYGPPGNGKTTIAEIMGKTLPGSVYVPYSIIVGGQIISIFDPVSHIPVKAEKDHVDQRWVLVRRPVVMTGGELTLKMLDLEFNPVSNFYVAPLQMKANNGLFIIDDFGRQQIPPQNLLNRWIVPLERRVDFMTLHTGMKFDIPFDQLTIFSTNIEPQKLVDEAFLRRIRYKIMIDHPAPEEYEAIFRRVCESNGVEFREDMFDYLMKNYYRKLGVALNACHPRDLIDHIIDDAHYYNHSPQLTKEIIDTAWENYFVEM